MSGNITRFVVEDDLTRDPIFEQMAEQISKEAKVSIEIVKKLGKKAIQDWETQKRKNINTVYYMKTAERSAEIDSILHNFKRHLAPVLESEKAVNKTMDLALEAFEFIFFI